MCHRKSAFKEDFPGRIDFILECYKCGHNIYIPKNRLLKLLETDCPNCGEEGGPNWIFVGQGNYERDHGIR